MRQRSILSHSIVSILTLVLTVGALAQTPLKAILVHDGLRLNGHVLGAGFSAACDTEEKRAEAFATYLAEHRPLRALTQWAAATAPSAACHVKGKIVNAHNLIPNSAETLLRDCFGGTGTPTCTAFVTNKFRYHGTGSGTTAAAETDTAVETEFTTQLNPDSTRATGSQTNSAANVYVTAGTNTYDASVTVANWGLMDQAATGGGNMWSHIVFTGVPLGSGDSFQTTYSLTIE